MGGEEFKALLSFFKALANENRLKIVGILANRGECGVEELAELLGLKEPTVSHHLGRLKKAGLVEMRVEGNDHLFRLNIEALQAMSKDVLSEEKIVTLVDDVEYDAWERKVLRTFMEGDQVKALPMGYKKRLVVLKWLASHFEEGVKYSELEVNAIITRYYEDYCLIRREFIEEGLMERKDRIYWRVDWQMPEFDK